MAGLLGILLAKSYIFVTNAPAICLICRTSVRLKTRTENAGGNGLEEDMLPAKGCLETKAFIEEMAQAEHKLMKRAFERERRIVQLNQADRFARRFGKKRRIDLRKSRLKALHFIRKTT